MRIKASKTQIHSTVHSISLDDPADLPVSFLCNREVPLAQALCIIDFHEIFTEVRDPFEVLSLLLNINNFLNLDILCHLETNGNEKKYAKKVDSYLGPNNLISETLLFQESEGHSYLDFMYHCRDLDVENIWLGGVYGAGCVFDVATRIGKNIYSKILGDSHPNIRYKDFDLDYQFENVVICDFLTEGHFDTDFVFPDYICFPEKILHIVDTFDSVEFHRYRKEVSKKYPHTVGYGFTKYTNLSENTEKFEILYNKICRCIQSSDKEKKSSNRFSMFLSTKKLTQPYISIKSSEGRPAKKQRIETKKLISKVIATR